MRKTRRIPIAIAALMYTVFMATLPPAVFSQDRGAGGRVTVELTAKNFKFSEKEIKVPAGATVVIRFTNKDEGIPHNFSVYTDKSAGNTIFKGEVVPDAERTEYTFTAPEKAGAYFFRCDIHPAQMNGVFTVTD